MGCIGQLQCLASQSRPIYSTTPHAAQCSTMSSHVLCPSWSNTKSILNSMCLTNGSTIFCRSVTSYSCLGMRFSAKSSTGSISIVSACSKASRNHLQETLPVQQTMLSLDWFKGKITGNHRFSQSNIGLSCKFSHHPIL